MALKEEVKEDDIYLKFGFFGGQTDRHTDIVVYREVTLPKRGMKGKEKKGNMRGIRKKEKG